jgi:hypothetical protein
MKNRVKKIGLSSKRLRFGRWDAKRSGLWNRQIAGRSLGGLHRGMTYSQAPTSLGQTGISNAAEWPTIKAWARDAPKQRAD